MGDKPNLDLLRSIAIFFVVAQHTLIALDIKYWGPLYILLIGPFGVYLFFVHTSLVLMWSLERRPNVLDFYIRRAFRLYPLAIVAVLIAAITHAPVARIWDGAFHGVPISFMAVVMNCLLVNGLIGHRDYIHGVMWSLPIEMFMYLLLPGLFFYARSVRRIWPLMVVFVFACLFSYRFFPPEVGNIFPVMVPNFLAGVIAYVGYMRRRTVLPSWTLTVLIMALLFSWGYLAMEHPIRFDWFACLALGLVLPYIRELRTPWLKTASHTVAKYSYGLYLLHPFTLVMGMYLLPRKPAWLQLTVELVPLIPMVWMAYHWVEKPLIDFGARVAAKLAQERGLPSSRSLEDLEPAP